MPVVPVGGPPPSQNPHPPTKGLERHPTWGVELEFKSLNVEPAADILVKELGGAATRLPPRSGRHDGGWRVADPKGRDWSVFLDGSNTEVTTPVLRDAADLQTLTQVASALRRHGALVDAHCGMHVHVGAGEATGPELGRLVALVHHNEPWMYPLLGVFRGRREEACAPLRLGLVERLSEQAPTSQAAFRGAVKKAGQERHHSLNVTNLGNPESYPTVEWRIFNGTLDAGVIASNVSLAVGSVCAVGIGFDMIVDAGAAAQKNLPAHRSFLLTTRHLAGLSGASAWDASMPALLHKACATAPAEVAEVLLDGNLEAALTWCLRRDTEVTHLQELAEALLPVPAELRPWVCRCASALSHDEDAATLQHAVASLTAQDEVLSCVAALHPKLQARVIPTVAILQGILLDDTHVEQDLVRAKREAGSPVVLRTAMRICDAGELAGLLAESADDRKHTDAFFTAKNVVEFSSSM